MSVKPVAATEACADLARFSTLIDVRSPAEFAEDHLPGAVNWPVLSNEQRAVVGTLYVQQGPLPARKLGAALVARNIADHLERWVQDMPRDWQPLVYCWRGGQRSGTMAWFLGEIGFRTFKLAGGYKAFRAQVRQDLAEWPARLHYRVLAGRTGSGKTRLLHALAEAGAQVLDLEGLACHRGSVLGAVPARPQPSQKGFDTLLWQALRGLDPARPVFVESESRKIGTVQVPDGLLLTMRERGQSLRVEMPFDARVQLLLQDYAHFAQDAEGFCRLLDGLVELRGRESVQRWQAQARAGQWAQVFGELMQQHYDPLYLRSMRNHFGGYDEAPVVDLPDGEPATLRRVASELLARAD